jgi:hypothetical protein
MASKQTSSQLIDNQDDQEHHVKFKLEEAEVRSHHENIEIHKLEHNTYKINIGYLKVDHYYKVNYSLNLGEKPVHLTYVKEKSSQNVNVKSFKREDDGLVHFNLVFHASKEKIDIEQLVFNVEDDSHKPHSLTIHLEAKVLGVYQGTPLLRNGITLLHSNNGENAHFNLH